MSSRIHCSSTSSPMHKFPHPGAERLCTIATRSVTGDLTSSLTSSVQSLIAIGLPHITSFRKNVGAISRCTMYPSRNGSSYMAGVLTTWWRTGTNESVDRLSTQTSLKTQQIIGVQGGLRPNHGSLCVIGAQFCRALQITFNWSNTRQQI